MKVANAPASRAFQRGLQAATRYRWVILLLMFLFYLINYADRANLGVVLPYVKKEFALTNLQAGALASFFFLGYAIAQVPSGLIMGRVGSRLATSLSVFAFSVLTFLIGASPGPTMMKWFRFFLGLGEGPAGIGAGSLLKAWFPHKEQGTATGIFQAASQVALISVPPVCVAIMIHWGWRMVFYLFAIPGIVMAVIWYILVRNRPEESSHCNIREQEYILQSSPEARSQEHFQAQSMGWVDTFIRVRRGFKALSTNSQVLRSWNVWAISIISFFVSICQYGMLTWIPSYLVNERHFSMIRMGLLAALPSCGSFVGFIGGGWASDRLWRGRRKPMMFLTAIAAVIMMYLLANVPASQGILAVLLFLTGLTMSSSMSLYISYAMGLTTRKTFPTALSMVACAGSLSGFLSPMIAGYLLDVFKTFNVVFYFFTIALAMTFVFALTMVEPLQTIGAEEE
ncbi:MAG: MFS transporter [Syntrophorhabdales bacterium]